MIKLYMQKAKDRHVAKELALLRASNPTPQMVSHMDEVDDAVIEEGIFRALEEGSKVASAIASSSEAPSDDATLNHRPAPPSDSGALGDSTRPNLQPLSASDTLSDHTIPIMQPSISSSKVTCHSTVVSPDVLIPSSAPYYAVQQRRGRPLPRTPAPGCKHCQILFTELQVK